MRKKSFAFCVWSLTVILSAGATIYAQTAEVLIKNAEAAIEKRDYDAALKSLDSALVQEPRLVSEMQNQTGSGEFADNKIKQVRYGLVNAL